MYDDFFELKLFGTIMLIFVLGIGLVVGLVALGEKNYCASMTTLAPTFEFHFDFWTGCVVEAPNGYWVDASEYRYIEGNLDYNGGE
jgi:hypothetical protein